MLKIYQLVFVLYIHGLKIVNSRDGNPSIYDFEIIPKNDMGKLLAASSWNNKDEALTEITKMIREKLIQNPK